MLSKARRLIRFGLFEVDLTAGVLHREGRKVSLQEQPFQILAQLLERPGEVVTREELRQRLWPQDTFVDYDAGLNTAIRKLREGLGDSADNPRFVETLPRRGYRFIAPVDAVGQATAPAVPETRRFRLVPVAGIAVAGLAALVALGGLNLRGRWEKSTSIVEAGQIRSVAVLPLENLTGEPGQEYFVDGMHDALITELAQIQKLRVISRTSVMRYRRTKEPVTKVAEELNVDAVIEGAVMRSGQRVRITAQLLDARNDRHLWAQSYERDLSDVLTLQRNVAREIAAAAKVELAPQERALLENPRPVNPEAYDDVLKGVHAALGNISAQGMRKAIGHYEDAAKKEPNFALPYAAMALAYYQFSYFGPYAPKEFMPKAESAARKALELDETIADAHFTLGAVLYRYHWDWQEAEREYRRAVKLPSSWGREGYSEFLSLTRRTEEAVAQLQRERERDPLSPSVIENTEEVLMARGQYDEVAARYKKLVVKQFDQPRPHYLLGRVYVLKGDLKEGVAELETAVDLSHGNPNPRFVAYLGYAYAVAGKAIQARKTLARLNTLLREKYISPYGIALIHVGLGEKEAAFEWLEKAYQAHAFELAELSADPRLNALRADPRFQDLARRVGPPPVQVHARAGAP
jgi:TolB-like protein/DNA-binding winged helix-turn-helix (wHTH) protein/Flp pilus assembly protein TadD